jgi:hypothetical protein
MIDHAMCPSNDKTKRSARRVACSVLAVLAVLAVVAVVAGLTDRSRPGSRGRLTDD